MFCIGSEAEYDEYYTSASDFEYTYPSSTLKDFPFSNVDTIDGDTTFQTTAHEDDKGVFQSMCSKESNTNFSQYDCSYCKGLTFISINA